MSLAFALILSSACGHSFDMLDKTDAEWVAPEYILVEEAVIDPMQYVESLSGTYNSVGCQVFFVDIDGIERWRVAIVGMKEIVILQEEEGRRCIPLDVLPTGGSNFSQNGRYLMVRESIWQDSMPSGPFDAALVDLETADVQCFSTAVFDYSGGFMVSNNGDLACFAKGGTWDLSDPSDPIRMTGPGYEFFNGEMDPEGSMYCSWFCTDSTAGLMAFNWDGSTRWQSQEVSGIGELAIEPGGSLVLCPMRRGLAFIDGRTGTTITEEYPNVIPTIPVFAPSGGYWTDLVIAEPIPEQAFGRVSGHDEIAEPSITMVCGQKNMWRILRFWFTSASGRVICWIDETPQNVGRGERPRNRLAILDASSQVLWVTRSGLSGGVAWENGGMSITGLGPISFSANGDRFAYNDEGLVRIIRLVSRSKS